MTMPWSTAETRRALADLASADLSVAEHARRQGIPAHLIHWARRKASAVEVVAESTSGLQKDDFDEVAVGGDTPADSPPIALRLPTGLAVTVTRN